jgi:magnesium transporter
VLSRKQQVLLQTISKLARKNAHRRLQYIVEKVHPVDLAIAFRFLNEEQQHLIFSLLPSTELQAEFLENLDDNIVEFLLADLLPQQIADLVDFMGMDEATDIIQGLDPEKAERVLALIQKDDRDELKTLISFEEDTAGGLMTTDFMAVNSATTAHELIDMIQQAGDEAETVFYIYAIDESDRLEGVVTLREVVQADPDTPLHDFMETDLHKVRPNVDQEVAAKYIEAYDLLALPVVDEENRLLGIITVDDIIDVIREENTEDLLRMVGADEELFDDYSLRRNIMSRMPWLLATWFGGIMVMHLIGLYENQLSKVVALAAFFPIILGMSGNVGQQSATIIVRGLAIGKVDVTRLISTIIKEAMTGLVIGLLYGTGLALVSWYQYHDVDSVTAHLAKIPFVVGLGQALGMMIAAILGSSIPLLLNKFKVDPAVATGPLVATGSDLICMWIFMSLASLMIF